jgi:hypothetical protein
MESQTLTEIRKKYQLFIFAAGGSNLFLFAMAFFFDNLKNSQKIFANPSFVSIENILIYFLPLAGAILLLIGFFFKKVSLKNLLTESKTWDGEMESKSSRFINKLVVLSIIITEICVAVGIIGFIFSVLTGNDRYIYVSILISFLCTLFSIPSFNQWETWIQQFENQK